MLVLMLLIGAGTTAADTTLNERLTALLGPRDAVMVAAPDGNPVVAVRPDALLVPASILKVVTALATLHHLGPEHRFITDFHLDGDNRLAIKGYGDPLLVSERVAAMAAELAGRLERIDGLVLDDTYFDQPLTIPGRGGSARAYDAPNGALCVNFNTFFFERRNGAWASAEPQTPLLPFMIDAIEASGLTSGRITIAGNRHEMLRYTGELFEHFLRDAGVATAGTIAPGLLDTDLHTLLWRHRSEHPLTKIIADLLEFSNNFIANQLLLAMGAQVHGPPATMEKGVAVLQHYYTQHLGITTGTLVEASGLSRHNRVSARTMLHVLARFQPHHHLMRQEGRQWYKTGTLQGVSTRVGYLESEAGGLYRFAVLCNTPGRTTDRIMQLLERNLR
ncbi:D-alanyl-D-alanine carboxypeptidase/D-alanyl-D-alanine-endopeptidase [Desulfatitalea alkaliphila]|uniref:D-alanyl-D-alanine carboxypeptidase n=1 Tax=Desulfatitalea alkaliphila TaxID=2929485 RepID=A0AA41R2E9_9BACT|nr:D-alanyl-D-alanine carboxypeptidase [Desulfatitalea alkaliphila]MCJ8501737.1 D-alanyl-D-alanine carboxypeptidase [Desulfatitalea alkaliphila]